jgi:hypothetical protein
MRLVYVQMEGEIEKKGMWGEMNEHVFVKGVVKKVEKFKIYYFWALFLQNCLILGVILVFCVSFIFDVWA